MATTTTGILQLVLLYLKYGNFMFFLTFSFPFFSLSPFNSIFFHIINKYCQIILFEIFTQFIKYVY